MNFFSILYTIIIYPLYQLIEFSFDLFQRLFKIPGISVIGVSFTVSMFCLPLYIVAERWQQKQRDIEKSIDPGVKRIKSCFKGDEQYMILSTYYRQKNYHPIMALRSSFGLLIQIPFFIAAYIFLSNLETLKGASFLFIKDMGSQDALFHIGSFPINVLPIAMTIINIIAGAIYTRGFKIKDKIQIYAMALVFLVILYSSPSGLVLYWTMNNLFSLVKNIFYKLKKPLKTLYILFCISLVALISIIMYRQPGEFKQSLAFCLAASLLFFIPLYVKLVKHLLNTKLQPLVTDSKNRLFIFLLASLALSILFGLFIPLLVISSSTVEFSGIENYCPMYFIGNSLLQSFGFFVFWPVCIYFLFHSHIQTILATLFSCALLCSLINVFLFSGNYGSLNRLITFTNPSWPGVSKISVILSFISIILCIAAILVSIAVKKQRFLSIFTGIVLISLVGVSVFNIHTVNTDYNSYKKLASAGLSNKNEAQPFYHLSKTGKNVVVFMLDRSENAYFEQLVSEYPDIRESLTGFTEFKNTISFNGHTIMGAPPFFGGYEYTPEEMNKRSSVKCVQKNNESLLLMPRIFTEQANWAAYVSDSSWANYSWISDMGIFSPYHKIVATNIERNYTQLWIEQHPGIVPQTVSKSIMRNLIWYSLFRCISPSFRRVLYNDGKWWEPTRSNTDIQSFIDYYSGLYYLPQLTSFDSIQNSFICITNETTHENMKLDQLGIQTNMTVEGYDQNVAAFKCIAKWIQQLKDNDCYDNTRIIIGGDHGVGYTSNKESDFQGPKMDISLDQFHPLLLYKDFNSNAPLSFNTSTFMTNADVPTLALTGIIDTAVNPFTGRSIMNSNTKDVVHICASELWSPGMHLNPYQFTISDDEWYTVRGSMFDTNNWHKGIEK
jgi:YidC/Oxa1 family membrane protein insertase